MPATNTLIVYFSILFPSTKCSTFFFALTAAVLLTDLTAAFEVVTATFLSCQDKAKSLHKSMNGGTDVTGQNYC